MGRPSAGSRWSRRTAGAPRDRPAPKTSTSSTPRASATRRIWSASSRKPGPSCRRWSEVGAADEPLDLVLGARLDLILLFLERLLHRVIHDAMGRRPHLLAQIEILQRLARLPLLRTLLGGGLTGGGGSATRARALRARGKLGAGL